MNLKWKLAQWLEIRWWQRYLKNKPKTEYLEWKSNYWKTFLDKIQVQVNSKDLIADIGCGPAGIFMVFPKNQVDIIDPLLDDYQRKVNHFSISDYPNVNPYPVPFENIPTDTKFHGKYDKVFCLNAINHVSNLKKCFMGLKQITKNDGQVILSIDTHNYWFFKYLFRLIPGDLLHPHQYDLKEYENMLEAFGFTIKKNILYKKEFIFNYNIIIAKK